MLIDTHAHLDDEKYDNIDYIISSAVKNGVEIIFCSAYDLQSSKRAFEISQKYPNVYCTIGIHPHNAKDYSIEFEKFAKSVANNEKVLSIGEIGLDYFYDLSDREVQKEIFEKQIKLSYELNLPITIHTRLATEDTLNILKNNIKYLKNGGCIHCFSGSIETAREYIKLGFCVSVGGSITFNNANKLRNVVKEIPLDKICLETDCPYLSPVPLRGSVNEPKNVKIIADKLAEIKEIDIEQVERETTKVALNYYKLNIGEL